jgi:hypothetical protein
VFSPAGHKRIETFSPLKRPIPTAEILFCNVRCFLYDEATRHSLKAESSQGNDNRDLKVLMERHLSSFLIVKKIPETELLIQVEI